MAMKILSLSLCAIVALVFGCKSPTDAEGSLSIQERLIENSLYAIALPKGFSTQNTYPLVVALHYGPGPGGSTHVGKEFLEVLIEPAYRDLGAILIAPDCPPGGNWLDVTSEDLVLKLIETVKTQENVDSKKIMLTGFSMGGRGTWCLVSRHQELFSCAVIVAGEPVGSVTEIPWNIPLYVIHSRGDNVLPIGNTESVVNTLKGKGVSIEYYYLNSIDHAPASLYIDAMKHTIPWVKNVWAIQ